MQCQTSNSTGNDPIVLVKNYFSSFDRWPTSLSLYIVFLLPTTQNVLLPLVEKIILIFIIFNLFNMRKREVEKEYFEKMLKKKRIKK